MNKKLVDAINTQINYEIESAQVYLAIQSYIATLGLDGFENWFGIQFEEELAHARKFIKYMNDRGARVDIRGYEDPRNEFSSLLETLEVSLAHEKGVTSRINNIMTIAHELKDYSCVSFLQWYVDEQVEEEDNFNNLIEKVKLVKDAGLYILDKELLTRVFVPIVY
ncbi:ferritin [Mariniplasma anaerobium]|uniref:Ferritin n=1 Tax=Mariniplasma anaerobium TaxID=2735436 RepID=A0A7U9XVK0_9MOLU|nr:ferritin [Mariniplasma anaerobium]BCR35239.1 ferritin [Mariniplasma anaerobium]